MRYQYQLLNFFEAALKFSISSKYKPVAAVSFLFYVFILCTLADMCVDTCSPPLFFFSTSCLFHAQINISVSGWKSQNLLKMQTFTANFTWCYLEVRLKIEEIWIWIIFIWPSLCTQKKNLTLALLSACTKKRSSYHGPYGYKGTRQKGLIKLQDMNEKYTSNKIKYIELLHN